MLHIILTAALMLGGPTTGTGTTNPFEVTTLHRGGVMVGVVIDGTGYSTRADGVIPDMTQKVETSIQDPNYPAEPWVVTTYRKDAESVQAFMRRHSEMVNSVREHLGT